MALSHCWGGPIAMTLTSSNLTEFSTAIPHEQLPRNFQDAIDITRRLGIRYLWIDSLCIVQDSGSDWAQESAKMTAVYENAFVTICALSSPDSAHGILNHSGSDPSITIPITVEGDATVMARRFVDCHDHESLENLSINAPLNRRAWCLQECILSPRILYYGRAQIYWGCRQGYHSANQVADGPDFLRTAIGPPGYHDFFPVIPASRPAPIPRQRPRSVLGRFYDLVGNYSHGEKSFGPDRFSPRRDQQLQVRSVLVRYYGLVGNYSRREKSFGSDTLPALSGITAKLHSLIGGHYLAGIWSMDFNRGLLWSPPPDGAVKNVEKYKAPSWSWACTNQAEYLHMEQNRRLSWRSTDTDLARNLQLQLLDFQIERKHAENPYGEVVSGYALVRGRTAKLRLVHNRVFRAIVNDEPHVGRATFDEPGLLKCSPIYRPMMWMSQASAGGVSWDFMVDNDDTCGRKDYLLLHVLAESEARESSHILLAEVHGTAAGTYRRVGLATIYRKPEIRISDWKERTLKMV